MADGSAACEYPAAEPMSARHIEAAPRSPASAERVERLAVACLCAAALGLDLYAAGFYHLGFDETWHVFIAGVRPSAQFLRELRWESHPPLSYVILRWLVPLHGAELWPRLPSIVPGLGSIVLAYLAARELGMGRPARLVVAVMFALASTPVSIALTVRAYSLATMLTLAAFVSVLRILRDHRRTGPRERWGFVVAAVLASWTEYSAVLTVLAMAAALAIHALRDRELRMAAVRGAARPSSWGPPLLLALGLVGVDRWLRWTHGRGQVGHVIDCFPAPGESLPGFALRGVTSTLDFFAPLGLASGRVPGLAIGLAAAAMLWLVVRYLRPGSPADGARASVPAIIALVWTAIFVLAHDGVYPFGGRMRHQFVLFPFFAFALALVVDDALARLRRPPARALVALILAVWTTVTGVARPPGRSHRGVLAGADALVGRDRTRSPRLVGRRRALHRPDQRDRGLLALQGSALESRETRSGRRPLPRQAHGRADDPRPTQRRVVAADPHRREDRRRARGGHAPPWPHPCPRDRGAFRAQADRRASGRRARGARHPRAAGPHPRSPLRVRARRGAARVGDPEDRAMIAALGAQVFGQSALARY